MTIPSGYFYDQQIRRWLLQFMRLFGGFNVKMGKNGTEDYYHSVPVRYGDTTRMSQHILRKNSENTILSVPAISCYIAEILPNAERRMNPTYKDTTQIFEKRFNEDSGEYENIIGETYTLERHAPIPYDLTISVDIWTSNTEQKLQLLEQILLLYNPSINLQSSQNPYDWTSLAVVELINITWSARSIPQGTDEIIDVASLIFQLPIFLTPPGKIKRQVLIHNILNNLGTGDTDELLDSIIINNEFSSRKWITFKDRHILVTGDYIQLLNKNNTAVDLDSATNELLNWDKHFTNYGGLLDNATEIRIKLGDAMAYTEAILKVRRIAENTNILGYELDTSTLPNDTLPMINAIINPLNSVPGVDTLPIASAGQRYLLTDDSIGWTGVASANDIIEFNGTNWIVSFDASAVNTPEYITNANTMKKLYFNGNEWLLAIEGVFEEGTWRIVN